MYKYRRLSKLSNSTVSLSISFFSLYFFVFILGDIQLPSSVVEAMQMQVHNYEIYVHCDTLIDVLDDDDDDDEK